MVNHWCAESGVPWLGDDHGYETGDERGDVLVADDADVSVIAAHAARYALDYLIGREPRVYNHAVYLIGLKRGWVFNEPLDTYPIEVGPPEQVQPRAVLSAEQHSDTISFVGELIDEMMRAASDPE